VDHAPICRYIRHHLHTFWARDMVAVVAAHQATLTTGIAFSEKSQDAITPSAIQLRLMKMHSWNMAFTG
jgi:hypothetical protein